MSIRNHHGKTTMKNINDNLAATTMITIDPKPAKIQEAEVMDEANVVANAEESREEEVEAATEMTSLESQSITTKNTLRRIHSINKWDLIIQTTIVMESRSR